MRRSIGFTGRGRGAGDDAPGLRHVVFVERGEGAARVERVSAAEALGRMMGMVYLGYCLEAMGLEGAGVRAVWAGARGGAGLGAYGSLGVRGDRWSAGFAGGDGVGAGLGGRTASVDED